MNTSIYPEIQLKKLLSIMIFAIGLNLCAFGQVGPGVGAGTVDAREVVRAAAKVLSETQSVKYKAVYQGSGAFSTHSPFVSGVVAIEKLAPNNPFKAKFAASGTFYQTGNGEAQKFHTVFDGTTINRLRPKENAVIQKTPDVNNPTERKLGFVTSFFGGGAYQLMLFEMLENAPLKLQTESNLFDYEGRTVVENVLCHVVYLEYSRNEKTIRERWYFGVNDHFPRRYEQLETDDKERHGAFLLTLFDVQLDKKLSSSEFTFAAPKGFRVKPFETPINQGLLPIDSAAPNWTLFDASKNEHSLSDYRGKVIVMDFWATWCGPCIKSMPDLQKLYDKYKSRGVEVIGINVWEESNAALYMRERGFTYNLLLNGEETAKLYKVINLPTLYIIGTDGKIIYRTTGSPK
ncbi:MAG TPA: TlpA disulfide reductase family protein, partial [Pyrinomonadaceae bacterium]|nr:TlpA disulfide reductase family protein [Pyrinomonadaceae bacterium]